MNLGADTMDLDAPWLTPTVEYETKELISPGVLSRGSTLVDAQGNRFSDETASYFEAGSAVMEINTPYIFETFDHLVTGRLAGQMAVTN